MDNQEDERFPSILQGATTKYQFLRRLGAGAFGFVGAYRNKNTQEDVAIKLLKPNADVAREDYILQRIPKSKMDEFNFVKFFESFDHFNLACFVFEPLEMSLKDFLEANHQIPLDGIRKILSQLLSGLIGLQQLELIHTDLKPANIMLVDSLTQPFRVKIIDFGCAFDANWRQNYRQLQTPLYRSPEVFLRLPFSYAIDMWSLGAIAAEMYSGERLFPGKSLFDIFRLMCQNRGLPKASMLVASEETLNFFQIEDSPSGQYWRLKTLKEANLDGPGINVKDRPPNYLLDLSRLPLDNERDIGNFLSLTQQMLDMDPDVRISPQEALKSNFLTEFHGSANVQKPAYATVNSSNKIEPTRLSVHQLPASMEERPSFNLSQQMLETDPNIRIDPEEALKSKFMIEIHQNEDVVSQNLSMNIHRQSTCTEMHPIFSTGNDKTKFIKTPVVNRKSQAQQVYPINILPLSPQTEQHPILSSSKSTQMLFKKMSMTEKTSPSQENFSFNTLQIQQSQPHSVISSTNKSRTKNDITPALKQEPVQEDKSKSIFREISNIRQQSAICSRNDSIPRLKGAPATNRNISLSQISSAKSHVKSTQTELQTVFSSRNKSKSRSERMSEVKQNSPLQQIPSTNIHRSNQMSTEKKIFQRPVQATLVRQRNNDSFSAYPESSASLYYKKSSGYLSEQSISNEYSNQTYDDDEPSTLCNIKIKQKKRSPPGHNNADELIDILGAKFTKLVQQCINTIYSKVEKTLKGIGCKLFFKKKQNQAGEEIIQDLIYKLQPIKDRIHLQATKIFLRDAYNLDPKAESLKIAQKSGIHFQRLINEIDPTIKRSLKRIGSSILFRRQRQNAREVILQQLRNQILDVEQEIRIITYEIFLKWIKRVQRSKKHSS